MRDAIAGILIGANIAFDCRASKKSGGARDDGRKWMKASAVNVFLEKIPELIWKLCDVRFLANGGEPEPLPEAPDAADADPDADDPPAAAPAAAPAAVAPAQARPNVAAASRASKQSSTSSAPRQPLASQPIRRAPARPQAAAILRAPARPKLAIAAPARSLLEQPEQSQAGTQRSGRRVPSSLRASVAHTFLCARARCISEGTGAATVQTGLGGAEEGRSQKEGSFRGLCRGVQPHKLGARQSPGLRRLGPRDPRLRAQALQALGAEGKLDLQALVPPLQN